MLLTVVERKSLYFWHCLGYSGFCCYTAGRKRKKKLCNILMGTEQGVYGIIMARTVFVTLTVEHGTARDCWDGSFGSDGEADYVLCIETES